MKKKLVISFYLLLTCWVSSAQTYPVQVSTAILPPYSLYLADYTTSDKLAVNVFFNDPVKFELAVKLKVTIEGQGISVSTKPEFNPAPIYLQSGFPEQLSGADLAQYFLPANLNFQGLNRNQIERTGALPEGIYRICIEVLEYHQNKKVSNSGCAMAWMMLNDPPIINYPQNGVKLKIQEPQMIIFNWTPRHTGSPNSAFSTEYDFELVEIRGNDPNPNNAILTSPPIYTATTQNTSLYYGIAETSLIPGQRYAFRVRARSMAGIDELELFKNNGYSEVYTFTYGDYCLEPAEVVVEAASPTTVKAEWLSLPGHTSFTIRYKENRDDAQWFEKSSMVEGATIGNLRPDVEYLIQLVGHCGVITDEEIKTYTVKTRQVEESDFICGADADEISLGSGTPISSLSPGQFIESSNFKIALVEVSANGDGTFTGRGVAYIPWFRLAGLKVEFKNIKVNEEGKVIAGNLVSIQSDNSNWVWTPESNDNGEPDEPATTGGDDGTTDPEDNDPDSVGDEPAPVVTIDGTIESVTKDDEGNLVVTDTNGNTTVVKDDGSVVKDSDGNEYTTDENGTIVQTATSGNNGGANVADNSSGGDSSDPDSPSANPSVSEEDLQFLKTAIALVKSNTDFTRLDQVKQDLEFRQSELKGSLNNERSFLLRDAPKSVEGSSNEIILINETTVELQDETPWGSSTFKSYKAVETEFNKLRILQIVCRPDIKDEELKLLGQRLLIENKSLHSYISDSTQSGLAEDQITEAIAEAIITFVEERL